MFRHALVQDAAYRSLLRQDRNRLHRQVGETIERLYLERLGDRAAVLGQHFILAGDDHRALKYFTLAGDTAAAGYANTEATAHYQQALELAQRLNIDAAQLLHLFIQLGRVLELNARYEPALHNYEQMEALAWQRHDPAMHLAALMARSTLYVTFTPVHDPIQAEELLDTALALARELDDQIAESKILWNMADLYMFSDRASAASIRYAERSVALARQFNLREQLAYSLNDIGLGYLFTFRVEDARQALDEAATLWRELGHQPMLADCLSTRSQVCLYAGEFEPAIVISEQAYQLSQSIGNLWGQSHSRHWIGKAYWEMGRPDQAITTMEDSIRTGELAGFMSPQITVRAELARVIGCLGQVEQGREIIKLAMATGDLPIVRGYVLAILTQLHLLAGEVQAAKAVIAQAKAASQQKESPFFGYVILADVALALREGDYIRALPLVDDLSRTFRRYGIQLLLPRTLYLQAQVLMGTGQQEQAHACLQEANSIATAIDARWIRWQILVTLSRLEPDPTEATPRK